MGIWLTLLFGIVPLLGWLLRWWNEFWYVFPLRKQCSSAGTNLPPGHMGIPFFGELFTFLWYFMVVRHPDDFINSKRRKYGDGVGMYRTYLFGSPTIIACFPSINQFVFNSSDLFVGEWPTAEPVLGRNALVVAQGKAHARLKSHVINAINRPDALRRIALLVQPRVRAALQSWAQNGKINAHDETKKLTFENIVKLFVSYEPGPLLDTISQLFVGILQGVRSKPPTTAYQHAVQCRKDIEEIFRVELEKRKNQNRTETMDDLMDRMMQTEDDEGNNLLDEEMLDNIINLMVAGYESTALSSMWAIYYLAKFPNVLKKLREENMAISQNKKGDFITSEDVSKMKYTSKVCMHQFYEKTHTSCFFFSGKDDAWILLAGYKIPKGWKVILWLRYLHTNPENFEDPMCFNPDRWNESPKPGTYRVFGGGPRICAGNMLARLQISILLHHLAVGYNFWHGDISKSLWWSPEFMKPIAGRLIGAKDE
ncbi:hypothetical protein L1049_028261 [Liquidambar formosana]|uniref:Cytochrome P450 n=1 Tax=Liquidambar formosana TaxID=63359 RepID=A0AAP0RK93_LIQFO